MTLFRSAQDREQTRYLLELSIPSYRQAYSDRTAWLMACLSELAYLRFNPLFSSGQNKQYFVDHLERLLGEAKTSSLLALIDEIAYDPDAEKQQLIELLGTLEMDLLETFDQDGTQAILVRMGESLVLAFRGTEAMRFSDIRTDLDAVTVPCGSGGMIHRGFKRAFEAVRADVDRVLQQSEHAARPLYVTGHSLGGALATIAARQMDHAGGIAACYTFGAPRVGDEVWISSMKTPLYRLVNAADAVTMLPPNRNLATVFGWVAGFVPAVGSGLRKFVLARMGGYLHGGNMRYLTSVNEGAYDQARLLYTVSITTRLRGLVTRFNPWAAFLADHSIAIYRQKLRFVAVKRNPPM